MAQSPFRRNDRARSRFVYWKSPWAKGHGEVTQAPRPPAETYVHERRFAEYALFGTAPVIPWAASLGIDIAFFAGGSFSPWLAIASENCIKIGLVFNLVAIVADLGGLTWLYGGTRAFRDTVYQLCLNVLVLSLYVQNEVFRNVQIHHDPRVTTLDIVMSLLALPLWVGVAYHGVRLLSGGPIDLAHRRGTRTGARPHAGPSDAARPSEEAGPPKKVA